MQSAKISLLSSSSPDGPPRPYSGWAVRTFPVRLRNSRPPAVSRVNPPSSPGSKPSLRPCCISSSLPGVQEIGELVGLNSGELERALCSRTMETAKEKVVTALNVVQVRGSWGGGWVLSLFCGSHTNQQPRPPGSVCPGCSG